MNEMNIYDIKYDYLENFIIGTYSGTFNLSILDEKVKLCYPNVNQYKIEEYLDSDGWNEGTFHLNVIK